MTTTATEAADNKKLDDALATLPDPVLLNLKDMCVAAKASLTELRLMKQSIISSIDISLAPLLVKRTALQAALDVVKAPASVIPSEAILLAPKLGQVNTTIVRVLQTPTEWISNTLFEIDRLLNAKTIANAEISDIDNDKTFFDDMITAIDKRLSRK